MTYEQLSKRWSSAIQNKEKVFWGVCFLALLFWFIWLCYFFINSSLLPFAEIEVLRADLFKKGLIPFKDFEDYKWPGRYLLYLLTSYFPGNSLLHVLNFSTLFFWGLYFFFKLKRNFYTLFLALAFVVFLLLYKGISLSPYWFLSPLLVVWWDKELLKSCWGRSVLTILSFLVMPSFGLIYLFSPGIQKREKIINLSLGFLLNLALFLVGAFVWDISWWQVWKDYYLFWRQGPGLGESSFFGGLYELIPQYIRLVFTLNFTVLFLCFSWLYFASHGSFVLYFKKSLRYYSGVIAILFLYPALSFKFHIADLFFLYLFMIFLLLRFFVTLKERKIHFELVLFIMISVFALGMKSFPAFYHEKDYSQKSYAELLNYLHSEMRTGDRLFVYAGAELYPGSENRYFLLYRDLGVKPFTYIWDKFSVFHHIDEDYQRQRQTAYIDQIYSMKPRFIVVTPTTAIRPSGKQTVSDFYDLMNLRTQEYRLLKNFETFYGPIALYEKNP